jgi:4-oxalomesaconate tautomerase
MSTGVRCFIIRGGTSKGAYFLAQDLPEDKSERDELLLRIMGSPDARQINGIGGAHPLTSKVAVVNVTEGAVDYLFLQVGTDSPVVSDKQNCGNLLAGVAPFVIERGLWPIDGETTRVPIRLQNSGGSAVAHVMTPNGHVEYDGDTRIDGVPGTAAPVVLDFEGTAGSTCGALLPTGQLQDLIHETPVTCVDNGMPVVVVAAPDLGLTGQESVAELEADQHLRARIERIRMEAGRRMGLGDVTEATVPKVSIVSKPVSGGAINTRTFIPHRVHTSIGVLGAASVAAAALLEGSVAYSFLGRTGSRVAVEHPTGVFEVEVELAGEQVVRTAAVRTARPIMDGIVFPRPRL